MRGAEAQMPDLRTVNAEINRRPRTVLNDQSALAPMRSCVCAPRTRIGFLQQELTPRDLRSGRHKRTCSFSAETEHIVSGRKPAKSSDSCKSCTAKVVIVRTKKKRPSVEGPNGGKTGRRLSFQKRGRRHRHSRQAPACGSQPRWGLPLLRPRLSLPAGRSCRTASTALGPIASPPLNGVHLTGTR